MAINIDLKPETEERLQALADARGVSVDEYLKSLIGVVDGEAVAVSLAEFEADLEAFASGTEHLPPAPITYSREDIYFDHD